jgi:hypothetical protein
MNLFAEIVVAASSVFLIGLAGIMFVKPSVMVRFIVSFASSARAHYTEMFFRLLVRRQNFVIQEIRVFEGAPGRILVPYTQPYDSDGMQSPVIPGYRAKIRKIKLLRSS